MSAILSPGFGNRASIRAAAIGNAAFDRAVRLGYSRIAALQFSRQAKRDATHWETPEEIAQRVVRPKSHSATCVRPHSPGSAA